MLHRKKIGKHQALFLRVILKKNSQNLLQTSENEFLILFLTSREVISVKVPITGEISETVHLGPETVWKGSNKKAVFYSPLSKSVPPEANETYEPFQQSFYQSRLLLPHFTLIIIINNK